MKCMAATAALVLVLGTGVAQAQNAGAAPAQKASGMNASVSGITFVYMGSKDDIVRTAQQVPQELYSFKPTPEVRSLGAILGHIADSQMMFCGIADGKTQGQEDMGSEKLTDKAALVKALNDSFAYCDGVLAKLTDADLAKPADLFGMKTNIAGVLALNAAHNMEHYGNLVTYMRLNKIVPPSSQPRK